MNVACYGFLSSSLSILSLCSGIKCRGTVYHFQKLKKMPLKPFQMMSNEQKTSWLGLSPPDAKPVASHELHTSEGQQGSPQPNFVFSWHTFGVPVSPVKKLTSFLFYFKNCSVFPKTICRYNSDFLNGSSLWVSPVFLNNLSYKVRISIYISKM